MLPRERAFGRCRPVCAIALLIAPALWNGFPLLQYDTGGYLARWYEGTWCSSRAVRLRPDPQSPAAAGDFWPVLVVQAALTVWVIALMLRAHGSAAGRCCCSASSPALTVFTTLPWLTSILLTDIFCRARRARALSRAAARRRAAARASASA